MNRVALTALLVCVSLGVSAQVPAPPDPMHTPEPICDGEKNDGVDISTPLGTPVQAQADGKILKVWNDEQHGCGATILIQHEDGSITGLAHLSAFFVKVGDRVSQGDQVALSGQSGNATSPTLHNTLFSPTLGKIDPVKVGKESAEWKRKNAFSATTVEVLKSALLAIETGSYDPALKGKMKDGIWEEWRRNRAIAEAEYGDNLIQATDIWYANNGDYKKIPQPLWEKLREIDRYQFKHSLPGKEVLSTARVPL